MTIKEAYQFLDLTESAKKDQVASRYIEKYNFFKMLHANAPNAIIRNLQEKNLQTLEEIKNTIPGVATAGHSTAGPKNPPAPDVHDKYELPKKENKPQQGEENPLAYLVVHTEELDTVSYPLFEGENLVGRNEVPGKKCILITQDEFVSRYHCTVIINENHGSSNFTIADDGRHNNGRPSLNGTYYNASSNRIKSQKLNNGDTVQIGMTKMVLKLNNASIRKIEKEVEQSDFAKTIVINI